MERIVEQNLLYDFYGELLTAHQKEIYGEHILNDMTATEIAAEFGITRQAVHDMIRRCEGNARPCQGRDRGFEPRLSLLGLRIFRSPFFML